MKKAILAMCLVVSSGALGVGSALAAPDHKAATGGSVGETCGALLKISNPGAYQQIVSDVRTSSDDGQKRVEAMLERHTLMDMLQTDPSKNLLFQHPWMAMSAGQRTLHMIYSAGVHERPNPRYGLGNIKYYTFFSGGTPMTDGRRVFGQYEALESVVGQVEAAAKGDSSGVLPVLLVGVPGSGKSEVTEVTAKGFKNFTLREPNAYLYTYEWKWDDIPELKEAFGSDVHAKACPIGDSPLVVLPQAVQQALVNFVGPHVMEMIGVGPKPKTRMCPHCQFIHDKLVEHYHKILGHVPNALELTQILNDHVVIKRRLLDETNVPIIPAQPKDWDKKGLFVGPDTINYNLLGQDHPLAYQLGGKVLKSNGAMVMWDEALKKDNPKDLLNTLLNYIQSGSVNIDGAPRVAIDNVNLVATNTKDVSDLKESDPDHPMLDRLGKAPMNWSIFPADILKIMAYGNESIRMTKLSDGADDEEEPIALPVREHLDELVPDVNPGNEVVGPDHRFNLSVIPVGENEHEVHISPHALMYIADVTALSRMNFDIQLAEKQGQFGILTTPLYRDPVTRIRALLGKGQLNESNATELWKLSEKTKEGTFGIPARKVNEWLRQTINEARKAENGFCVTPQLARQVLEKLITKGEFGKTIEEQVNILKFADLVYQNLTYNEIQTDVMTAIQGAEGSGVAQIYDEIIEEIIALHQNPKATKYISKKTNQPTNIRRERFAEISAIFKRLTGQNLAIDEIALFVVGNARSGQASGEPERHRDLMKAIMTWQTAKVTAAHDATLQKIINIATQRQEGSSEERGMVNDLLVTMSHRLGYCPHCMAKALEMIQEHPGTPKTAPEPQ